MAGNIQDLRCRISRRDAKKVYRAFLEQSRTTLPVLPNVFPYNEMLFRGLLDIGEFQASRPGKKPGTCGVRTRSWNWHHRGTVLLYTSKGIHLWPAQRYGLNPEESPRGMIVGVGELADVREFTDEEKIRMTRKMNGIALTEGQIKNDARKFGFLDPRRKEYMYVRIHPYDWGFFFRNLRRFKTPVPFTPPRGAVSIFRAQISLVARALNEIKYDIRFAA